MAKIKPINDKVLVKRLEAEGKTKGGIILPDNARRSPARAASSPSETGR